MKTYKENQQILKLKRNIGLFFSEKTFMIETFKMKVCFLCFAKNMTCTSVVKVSTFVCKIVLIKRKSELISR